MNDIKRIMETAYEKHIIIPAFNMPHLPMMKPVVEALREKDAFALIAVARLEWMKFSSKSIEAVAEEYARVGDAAVTRLHLDHVPVIDEDHLEVPYMSDIKRAIDAGFQSVMVDGSRLNLQDNINAVKEVTTYAHSKGVPVEAELGAVMGHEDGPMPSYEELFSTGKGFTNVEEAKTFVKETSLDWLSVAVGSVHGAISPSARDKKKVTARLHMGRLAELDEALGLPLVLHGGSGIALSYLLDSFKHGIAKLNIGTDIRQAYESNLTESVEAAQKAVYKRVLEIVDELQIANSARFLIG
ncbi:class II fructose-bisphosphate aldolase [Pleomorphochaeta sp. DL1XJH-081]|uniref:class II fructose-bisphosphate aldolase n=1 Tax=Pleomorphochaeta sp. DL1XJH-081 TaxID=3409690 RepID=UPI003BB8130B